MVLADLARKLNSALNSLSKETVIDQDAVDKMLKDICVALMEADVNVKLVQQLRSGVKNALNLDEVAAGLNKRRLIQQAVYKELVKITNPDTTAYKPRRKKQNWSIFYNKISYNIK